LCYVPCGQHILALLGSFNFSHSRFVMPPRKRRVVPSGTSVPPPQKRPTVPTSGLCGPDVTPATRGRPVTRHATADAPDPIASAADATATAALAQLEASGRLLPAPASDPTFDGELSQQNDDVVSFRPVDSVSDDILNVLRGDVPSQSPTYSIINRPLGGNLPIDFKQKIWNGDFINLHMLLKDQEFEDPQNSRWTILGTHSNRFSASVDHGQGRFLQTCFVILSVGLSFFGLCSCHDGTLSQPRSWSF
jgi:hypothetical protein